MSKPAFDKINEALRDAATAKISSVSFEADGELQTWVKKGHESTEHKLALARQRVADLEHSYDGAVEDNHSTVEQCFRLIVAPEARPHVAWWLCANYRTLVFGTADYEIIREAAESAGPPPRGTWDEWFEKALQEQTRRLALADLADEEKRLDLK